MSWNELKRITGNFIGENLGTSISLNYNGIYMAVGSPGAQGLPGPPGAPPENGKVQIYKWDGTINYNLLDTITDASTVRFGTNVILSSDGTIIAISDPRWDIETPSQDIGKIFIYELSGSTYISRGTNDISGININDNFGLSLSMNSNGNIIAASAVNITTNESYVKVYEYISGNYVQKGNNLSYINDNFGISTRLNSNGLILAVGSNSANIVKIYNWNTNTSNWDISGEDISGVDGSNFGAALDINSDGSIIAIGAPTADSNTTIQVGSVQVYQWSNSQNKYIPRGSELFGINTGDLFGDSVKLSSNGNILAIGSPYKDNTIDPDDNTGAVKIYEWNGTNYVPKGSELFGDVSGEEFGYDIALSGNGKFLLVGAPLYDSTDVDVGTAFLYSFNGDFPCLFKDTLVLTPKGYIKITKLKKGDKLLTSDKRIVKIINIYKSKIAGTEKSYPYIIPKKSIGKKYPLKETRISRAHLINYKNNWIHPKKNSHIFKQDTSLDFIEYYHIELENYLTDHLVINGGLVVESFIGKDKINVNIEEWNRRYKESIILEEIKKDNKKVNKKNKQIYKKPKVLVKVKKNISRLKIKLI